jgi:hypothetical protein
MQKSPGRPPSVRIPENTAQVLVSIGLSPRQSACMLAQAVDISDKSVRRILHSDQNLLYRLRTMHAWIDRDKAVRLQFCRHFHGILTENC